MIQSQREKLVSQTLRNLRMIPFLIILLLAFFILSSSAQDELQFVFEGFHGASLQLDGIAEILPNGLLKLTNTSNQEKGHAFYQQPLKFNTSSSKIDQTYSFSTTFVFAMVPQLPNFGGHGLAFVVSPSLNMTQTLPSQFLGLLNDSSNGYSSNHVFAVEFDTVKSPDFDDIDENHVGIDINNLRSNVSVPVSYYSNTEGVNKSLELMSGDPIQAWIDYNWTEKLIQVTVAPFGVEKPIWPLLSSSSIDLSTIMLDSMYVGFSSATGAIASNHYILGWSFSRNGEKAQNLDLSKLPSVPRQKNSKKRLKRKILIPVMVSITLWAFAGIVYLLIRKMKYREVLEDWEQEYGPHRFCYKDLYKATKGFRDRELLGVGGFGKVYRGVLTSSGNGEIAVKKISHESSQGMKEFVAEIVSMGRLRHRNLVQLLGYCRRKGELLLVYDYMPNGSLDKYLFSNEKEANQDHHLHLNWPRRYQIIKGIASALLYLHEESEKVVLHRDVKASNVLLDADLNGKLGDFGLARFYDRETTPQTTSIVGTIGYLAPELTRTGKATTSSDVFAFGAFLLEMVCGRRPVDSQKPPGETILVDWVLEHWKQGRILQTIDPRLEENYFQEQIELTLKLGLLCSHSNPRTRPFMREVMQFLDGNAAFPDFLLNGTEVSIATTMGNQVLTELDTSSERYSHHYVCSNESILSNGR